MNFDKKINLIWAQADNNLIGIELNDTKKFMLPWNFVPNPDLKHFRSLTENNVVVMGYNTFLSFDKKPLPNRINIVLTRSHYDSLKQSETNDFKVCKSKEEALQVFDEIHKSKPYMELFVIGGASLYNQFIDVATDIYQTIIKEYVPYYADESMFKSIYISDIINKNEWFLKELKSLYPFEWKHFNK